MKISKRMMTFMLSALMCISLFPVQVFAEDANTGDLDDSTAEEEILPVDNEAIEQPAEPAEEVPAFEPADELDQSIEESAGEEIVTDDAAMASMAVNVTTLQELEDALSASSTANVAITKDITLPTGERLTISENQRVTVSAGATFTTEIGDNLNQDNYGRSTLILNGSLTVNEGAELELYGDVSLYGTLTVNGTFINGSSIVELRGGSIVFGANSSLSVIKGKGWAYAMTGEFNIYTNNYLSKGIAAKEIWSAAFPNRTTDQISLGNVEIVSNVFSMDELDYALAFLNTIDTTALNGNRGGASIVVYGSSLELTESIVLPAKVTFRVAGTLIIPENVTLNISGYFQIYGQGMLQVNGILKATGKFYYSGAVEDHVTVGKNGKFMVGPQNSAELKNIIDEAAGTRTYISVYSSSGFMFDQDMTIPQNIVIYLDCPATIAKGVTLTNNSTIDCYQTFTVNGTLINAGTLCGEENSVLTVSSSGRVENNSTVLVYGSAEINGTFTGNDIIYAATVTTTEEFETAMADGYDYFIITGNVEIIHDVTFSRSSFWPSLYLQSGTLTVKSGATLTAGSYTSVNSNSGTQFVIEQGGHYVVGNGQGNWFSGDIQVYGTIDITGYLGVYGTVTVENGGVINNNGTINLARNAKMDIAAGGVLNLNGSLYVQNGSVVTVENDGILQLGENGTYSVDTTSSINGKVKLYPSVSGDCDGNGVINQSDLLLLCQYLAGYNVSVKSGADMNSDGSVNLKDLLLLKRTLADA